MSDTTENPSLTTFNQIQFADGELLDWSINHDTLHLLVQNWKEEHIILRFDNVTGLEFYPFSGNLSHGTASATHPMIARACNIVSEDAEGLLHFALYSAWTDEPILQVVARTFTTGDHP